MLLVPAPVLAVWYLDGLLYVLGALLVVVSLILIFIILIQDSKGAGLTSAFGAGPGGESLLGARMQRDVARYTSYIALVFAAIVIAMGLLNNCRLRYGSVGGVGAKTPVEAPGKVDPGTAEKPAPGAPQGSAAPAPSTPPAAPPAEKPAAPAPPPNPGAGTAAPEGTGSAPAKK